MKRVLGPMLIIAVVLVAWHRQSAEHPQQSSDSTTIAAVEEFSAPPQMQEPVGWVFGRLIGFPGADRPMMSGTGLAPPPVAGSHRPMQGDRR